MITGTHALSDNPRLRKALRYAKMGIAVRPKCRRAADGSCGCGEGHEGAKIGVAPLLSTCSAEPTKIREWWRRYPGAEVDVVGDVTLPRLIQPLEELRDTPPPEPLVGNILFAKTHAIMFGEFGNGKSFIGVGLACSVAAGIDWANMPTKGGPVVYIAAERFEGVKRRVEAWEAYHGQDLSRRLYLVKRPVNFLDPASMDWLIDELLEMPERPVLMIVDTVSKAMIGGDGSTEKDMKAYVDACRRITEEVGATVISVHHPGWENKHERGSTVLPGDVDTRIQVHKKGDLIRLTCGKQSEDPEFDPLTFRLEKVGETCVAVPTTTGANPARKLSAPKSSGKLTTNGEKVRAALASSEKMMRRIDIRNATNLQDAEVGRAFSELEKLGLLVASGKPGGKDRAYGLRESDPAAVPSVVGGTPTHQHSPNQVVGVGVGVDPGTPTHQHSPDTVAVGVIDGSPTPLTTPTKDAVGVPQARNEPDSTSHQHHTNSVSDTPTPNTNNTPPPMGVVGVLVSGSSYESCGDEERDSKENEGTPLPSDVDTITRNWKKIRADLALRHPMANFNLSQGKSLRWREGMVLIEFRDPTHKLLFDSSDHGRQVAEAIEAVTGLDVPVVSEVWIPAG